MNQDGIMLVFFVFLVGILVAAQQWLKKRLSQIVLQQSLPKIILRQMSPHFKLWPLLVLKRHQRARSILPILSYSNFLELADCYWSSSVVVLQRQITIETNLAFTFSWSADLIVQMYFSSAVSLTF